MLPQGVHIEKDRNTGYPVQCAQYVSFRPIFGGELLGTRSLLHHLARASGLRRATQHKTLHALPVKLFGLSVIMQENSGMVFKGCWLLPALHLSQGFKPVMHVTEDRTYASLGN